MNKIIFRIWILRFCSYLIVLFCFCTILFPLYNIMKKQTTEIQLKDVSEQMVLAVNDFEEYIRNISFTTNKLFNSDPIKLLASSTDERIQADYMNLSRATMILQDLTYSMPYSSYSYITFKNNNAIIDEYRTFLKHEQFYPAAIEYKDISREKWEFMQKAESLKFIPAQTVTLNRTVYPDSQLTIIRPYVDNLGRYRGNFTTTIREKTLANIFLNKDKWKDVGLFYIVNKNNEILVGHHYDNNNPLNFSGENSILNYKGKNYCLISKTMDNLNMKVVVGLPYSMFADGLRKVDQAIFIYFLAGILICLLTSIIIVSNYVHKMRPVLNHFKDSENFNLKDHDLNKMILRDLNNNKTLINKMELVKNQLNYIRIEGLLKSGLFLNDEERESIRKQIHLTDCNYLLFIKLDDQTGNDSSHAEVLYVLISEQVHTCYGEDYFTFRMSDGNMIVIIPLKDDSEKALYDMCEKTEKLHNSLNLTTPIILSARFSDINQASDIYWKARNRAANCDQTQSICFLSDDSDSNIVYTDITGLERLNEYLLAGNLVESQKLIKSFFPLHDLSLQNYYQTFYSVRGILISVIQKIHCTDVSYLCNIDMQVPAEKMVQNLQDCCFEICNYIDSLKQSHNNELKNKMISYLEENYHNPNLNVTMVASQFNLSQKYVSQFIKEQTGRSYSDYIENFRLTKALELLKNTQLSITEISNECGFASQNTFYKTFKRRYDTSPSSIRKGTVENMVQ